MSEMLNQSEVSSRELEVLLKQRAEGTVEFLLVDVRELPEYDEVHIAGVDILKSTTLFPSWGQEFLDKYSDKTVIFTCRSGHRSGQVQDVFKQHGLTKVINHAGGIISYTGETE
jgi:rhodanese-related sulfurtransferase